MKKVLAILFAMMVVVATTGLCFAQARQGKGPREEGRAQEGRQEGRQEEG